MTNEFASFIQEESKSDQPKKTIQTFVKVARPNTDFLPGSLLVNETDFLQKAQDYVDGKIKKKISYATTKWTGSRVEITVGRNSTESEIHGASINRKSGEVNTVNIDLSGLSDLA